MKQLPKDSFYTHSLAKGCKLCMEGSKLVLLITGKCSSTCFYCPLSEHKKDKDVMYANELLVKNEDDILEESYLIDAQGAGITGGDPLLSYTKTKHAISLLKKTFSTDFHIHLYTSHIDIKKIKGLETAGLDEIRFHPSAELWNRIGKTQLKSVVKSTSITKGLEIPAIPHLQKDTVALLKDIDSFGLDFININELEFSPTNVDALDDLGYSAKNDESAAVKGSQELAYSLLTLDLDTPLHYCSASFKDGVQLRKRIERRARNVAKPYELITEDGTLIKGIIEAPDDKIEEISSHFSISSHLIEWNNMFNRIEIAPFILEDIAHLIPYNCYIIEEYPTADRLEVERTPL